MFIAIFALVLVQWQPGSAQTCGVLTNSGFENDLTGWVNNGSTTITSDVHGGSKAAQTGTGEGGLNSSLMAVTAGQQITFTVWAKVSGSPVWAGVGMDFLDATETELGEIAFQITETAYTEQTETQTIPAGATHVRLWTWKTGTAGNLFVDDFCITVPLVACGAVTNSSFENGLNEWINNGSTSVSTDAHSGANAAVTGTGEGGLHYGSIVPATGGQSVTFTVWGKVSGSPSWAGAGIDYFDANGTELGEEVLNITSPSYTEYTVNSTAPAGTANINIWTWKSGTAGNLFLDDFCLTVSGSGGGGNFDIAIDKGVQHQTIDGFGFFGAQDVWWSSPSELFSEAWAEEVITDLGITIWRNEYYPPADQYSGQDADWNKQLPVVRGLRDKADEYGVDLKFIATVWSPPSSMKVQVDNNTRLIGTPHPFGTKQGGALDPTKYNQFADWLIDGIELYENEGIDLYAISPQNEPFFVHSFNSCWYKQEWYPEMLVNAIPMVKSAYPDVKIFGSEGMLEMEAADHNWQWFYHKQILDDAQAEANIDILAVHGYSDGVAPTSGSTLGHLWENHKSIFAEPMGKPQWMTETSGYNDSWENNGDQPGAFSLALDIMSGLNNGDLNAWVWWQGSENPGSTSGIGEFALMNGLVKGKKYYASKQFYRYIRPGAVRIAANSNNNNVFVSAYQHTTNGTHTIILANTAGTTQNVTLGGDGLPSSFTIFRTSASENCANVGSYTAGNTLSLPPRSLVTLQAGGTPLGTGGSSSARAKKPRQPQTPAIEKAESRIGVYPNPLKGNMLTIDISNIRRAPVVEVQLSDMSGNLIRTYSVSDKKLQINRSELPRKGLYLLNVDTGYGIERTKVMLE